MFPSTFVFTLLPLLLVQVEAAVIPARRLVAERDVSFESVRNAVVAFAQPSLEPISDPTSTFDLENAPIPTPFFEVFAAEQGEQGHWIVYTTSSWIPAADPTSTPPSQDQPEPSTAPAYQPVNSVVSSLLPSSLISSVLPSPPTSLNSSPLPTSAPFPTASPQPAPPTGGGDYLPGKHVFAHFMVGIVSTYHQQDWVNDIQLAKQKGITGFALNIGVDPYTQDQLDLAYAAAESVGDFQMFISFDFNWYKPDDTNGVATMMKRYVDKPAQLLVDGKPFVSSFIGDGFDWKACAEIVGREIYAVPFFQPTSEHANDPGVSGLFSWAAWPGQLDNQPLKANMTLDRDEAYLAVLDPAGKQYMAPASPPVFTHFGPEVPYSKNWLFYSESLWKTRWEQILELGSRGVNFVEIVTWNDYGEAHHVGPYNTPHTDDEASKWAEGLDHSAMLEFAVPYIEAFKQGKREPVINKEMLVYWHRPHMKDANCDATDNCGSKPKGWDYVDDVLFVSTMTSNGGTVIVNSGSGTPFIQTVEAGVQTFEVPMQVGEQRFQLLTNAGLSAGGSSNVTVTDSCWNGIYNFNFHSGIIA